MGSEIQKSFFEELKDAILQRFSSPVLGSFLIIWSIVNWEVLVQLFFATGALAKVAAIKNCLGEAGYSGVFFIPAILTVLYCGAIPLAHWANGAYFGWIREKQVKGQIASMHRLEFYRTWGEQLPFVFKFTRGRVQDALSKSDAIGNLLLDIQKHEAARDSASEALKYVKEYNEKLRELVGGLKKFEAAQVSTLNDFLDARSEDNYPSGHSMV